jgi:hypothetical protein
MLLGSKRVGGIEPPLLAWKAIKNAFIAILSALKKYRYPNFTPIERPTLA